jgi:alkylhydroperoxidase family enzyme
VLLPEGPPPGSPRRLGNAKEGAAHVLDDPLPEGLFTPDQAAIVVFCRKSTLMQPIDDATWAALREHFTTRQVLEITFTCGLNQMISRFHAAVRTDVDAETLDQLDSSCPVRLPDLPAGT